jgi:outer membrane lipoprotein carrier protein
MMKTMKHLLTFIVLIALSVGLASTQPSVYDEKGEALVRAASKKIQEYRSFEIAFSYIMENETQSIYEKMDGILLSQGDKYSMKVGGNTFISDGVNVWTYLEDFNEVHISLAEDTEGGMTPTSLFAEFETQFRSRFIRQERHEGSLVDIIDLVPHQPQAFFKYRVALDAADNSLVYTIAYDRHGGSYTYSVRQFRPNVRVPENAFTFSPSRYPGIEVIDLR